MAREVAALHHQHLSIAMILKGSEEPIDSSLPSFAIPCRNPTVGNFIRAEALHEESTAIVRIARCRDLRKKVREEPPPPFEEKLVETEKQAAAIISKPYVGL
ncbi:hypothetical protein ACLOJK_026120 [Asimina triloba]